MDTSRTQRQLLKDLNWEKYEDGLRLLAFYRLHVDYAKMVAPEIASVFKSLMDEWVVAANLTDQLPKFCEIEDNFDTFCAIMNDFQPSTGIADKTAEQMHSEISQQSSEHPRKIFPYPVLAWETDAGEA